MTTMNELSWRQVTALVLKNKLISYSARDVRSELVREVGRAKVALDGYFIHILPELDNSNSENPPVTVVPAIELERLTYTKEEPLTAVKPGAVWGA